MKGPDIFNVIKILVVTYHVNLIMREVAIIIEVIIIEIIQ